MEIVPFKADHLAGMRLQSGQAWAQSHIEEAGIRELEGATAFTALEDGQPVACAGVAQVEKGRWIAWSYLSDRVTARNFLKVHNAVRGFLHGFDARRIEMVVDHGFLQGHKWARMLGFSVDAPCMRKYNVDGSDATLYALVK